MVSENVVETVCNSLRASSYNLKQMHSYAVKPGEKEILNHQLKEVSEALAIFESFYKNLFTNPLFLWYNNSGLLLSRSC